MKAPDKGAAVVEAPEGESSPAVLADWQRLHFPSEDRWVAISDLYPETFGIDYYQIAPWIRLGWPSEELWTRVQKSGARVNGRPVINRTWAELQALYPDRANVDEREQDLARMARCWPDCFGQGIVEVELLMTDGITINNLTFGPGRHRVPETLAVVLRHVDGTARQHFIDQFIPKKHQDKVIATLSMKDAGGGGEIRE